MATAASLALDVAARLNDPLNQELDGTAYLSFVNQALQDLDAAGWVQPLTEDVSLTIIQNQYDYDIPSGFAFITGIIIQDSDGNYLQENLVPQYQWYVSPGNPAKLHFYPDYFDISRVGRAIKIMGKGRFSAPFLGTSIIPQGVEAFVRERAVGYAGQSLSLGNDEQAQRRWDLGKEAKAYSEKYLGNHPMEFRAGPDVVLVPLAGTPAQTFLDAYIVVDGVTYPQTQAGIAAALLAASLAGPGHAVLVPGGLGAIVTSSTITAQSYASLRILNGTWLEAAPGAASYSIISTPTPTYTADINPVVNTVENMRTTVVTSGAAASIGLADDDYVLFYDNTLAKNQMNRVRHVEGDTIYWYDPIVYAQTTTDRLKKMVTYVTDFEFEGEIRSGSNNGDCFAIYMPGSVNWKITNSSFNGFDSLNALGTAVRCEYGYNGRLIGNYDKGSGSAGYASFDMRVECQLISERNQADPHLEFLGFKRSNTIAAVGVDAFGDQTVTLDAGASVTNNAYSSTTLIHGGTAQAGGAATITLALTASTSDTAYGTFYNIYIASGTGAGQARRVLSYVGATRVMTVYHNWTVVPDNTSVYEIRAMGVLHITAGPGAGQEMFITQYVGATKVCSLGPGAFGITVNNTSRYTIEDFMLYQDREAEGFGFLYAWCHQMQLANNGSAMGNGRQVKFQNCYYWSDQGTKGTGGAFELVGYAVGDCQHFTVSNLIISANAGSGFWSFGNNVDGKFIGCDFTGNDQDFGRLGYGGSADISILAGDTDLWFIGCKYNSVFDGGTRTRFIPDQNAAATLWVGADRFGPAAGAPTFSATGAGGVNISQAVWLLDAAAAEAISAEIDLPDSWNLGSFTGQIHWAPTNNNVGNVVCLADIRTIPVGAAIDTANTWGQGPGVNPAGGGVAFARQVMAAGSAVTPTTKRVRIVIYRDAAVGADTYNADAAIIGIELSYTRKY